jgi:aminobenzoyl-glutamate utilization protein A
LTGTDGLAALVDASLPAVVEHRRTIHRRAELGWCEFATTSYLRRQLAEMGVDRIVWGDALFPSVERLGVPIRATQEAAGSLAKFWGVPPDDVAAMIRAGTGVVAEIVGSSPGPVVGVRVDLDALPIEESAAPGHRPAAEGFASEVAGVMHACGHDGHVAIGLGVARVLCQLRDVMHGTVRLLFQPAEEGTRGAVAFVDAGWLDDVQALVAMHISGLTGLRTGSFSPGVAELLATTKFDVRFHGRAAHFASAPERGRSALMAASAVALLSQAIPRRPGARALVNVGRVDSGTARNVVPEHGELQMEVRAETDEEVGDLFSRVKQVVDGIGRGLEVETEILVVGRSPAADSSADLAATVAEAGAAAGLSRLDGLTMEASDDAAAMMRRVQDRGGSAVYLKVGTDLAGGNHTPTFDFDEGCLRGGVELVARAVLARIGQATGPATS